MGRLRRSAAGCAHIRQASASWKTRIWSSAVSLQVALDPGAELERGGEGEQAVFGKPGAMVQPAVREPRGAGIERIRL